jgi:hypothetical protein
MNNSEPNDSINNLLNEFTQVNNSLSLFKMHITTLQNQIKSIEKKVKKELKNKTKKQKM